MRPEVTDLTTDSSFDSQATWVFDVCLYNQALPDVRLICAGVKCLYYKLTEYLFILKSVREHFQDVNTFSTTFHFDP